MPPPPSPSPDAPLRGIDVAAVSQWAAEHVPAASPPFEATLIAGGRSNLTFLLTDSAGSQMVLRRPPLGHVLESAHDMGREYRIISALQETDVPVAGAIGNCEDPGVIGAPFYLMTYVQGAVLHGSAEAERYPQDQRAAAAHSLITAMAALHAVDPGAVGLGDLSRRSDGYIERQLRRWHKQFHDAKTRELPVIDEVHRLLAASTPPQRWTGIVHGDYRLGNVMLGDQGQLLAVLDWELATLGDTLADLGWLLSYWTQADEPHRPPADAPSTVAGFPERAILTDWYHELTGRDLSDLPYYVAFARWRLACIGEGVLARYQAGVMGDDVADTAVLSSSVVRNAEEALRLLRD